MSTRALVILGCSVVTAIAVMTLSALVLVAMTLEQPLLAGYGFRGYDMLFAVAGAGLSLLILNGSRPSGRVAWSMIGWLFIARVPQGP
jgi:hypothetical protein